MTSFRRSTARTPRAAFALFAALLLASTQANAADDAIFGLSISIARDPAAAPVGSFQPKVVDDAWMQSQIDDANRLFSPLGTRFRWTIEKDLAEPHGELHSRADRDALTPLTERNSVDVFLVRDLEDVDEPGRFRMGVCWTGRGGKRFIVVARSARPTVLAHELGHFFGNQPHSTVVNNLMSYSREPGAVFLDEKQSATIKNFSARFLESGRLIDVGPPRRFF